MSSSPKYLFRLTVLSLVLVFITLQLIYLNIRVNERNMAEVFQTSKALNHTLSLLLAERRAAFKNIHRTNGTEYDNIKEFSKNSINFNVEKGISVNSANDNINSELQAFVINKSNSKKSTIDNIPKKSTIDNIPKKSTIDNIPKKSIIDNLHNQGILKDEKASKRSAVLFTMDSISSYEESSRNGGAAGEILIRNSLVHSLRELGVTVDVKRSDSEFELCQPSSYDYIILDPWTWAARGWVPKSGIKGQDHKIFILDFFGSQKLRGTGLSVPPHRFLTAFGSPWNTFLGYFLDDNLTTLTTSSSGGNTKMLRHSGNSGQSSRQGEGQEQGLLLSSITKKQQGVIWGKDPKHFEGKQALLSHIADHIHLISTASTPVFRHNNIEWRGTQTRLSWLRLLQESKFMIGLENPLLGPSAIDAISSGCMFINPLYEKPYREIYWSQHPYAAQHIGEPYVCSVHLKDEKEVMACVNKAIELDLKPFLPNEFTNEAHRERVRKIFLDPVLPP